jgi:hypothetical protein
MITEKLHLAAQPLPKKTERSDFTDLLKKRSFFTNREMRCWEESSVTDALRRQESSFALPQAARA